MAKGKPKNKPKKKDKNKKPAKPVINARNADRYDLYLKSVQEPTFEIEFFDQVSEELLGEKLKLLREDFCGTAAVCCEWVKSADDRVAIGLDLDPEPLAWSRQHLQCKLTDDQLSRLELIEEDVRHVNNRKVEILAAQNFSFYCFFTRDELRDYFKAAYDNLAERGLFVLDMMGGSECFQDESIETTSKAGFKYIWELESFDPITHHCTYHIHFKFKDGSRMNNAFTYEWRLWTLPEVREILIEAGFDKAIVYWEGTDEDGEGDGEFTAAESGDADPSWICYVVGVKGG